MNTVLSPSAGARPVGRIAGKHPRGKPRILRQVAALFRARNETPWWLRDAPPGGGGHGYSWIDLFTRDGFRCVYCRRDLSVSALSLAMATRDHVVPRSLFSPESEASRGVNVVTCCATCNWLKANWHPASPDDPAWRSRAGYIAAARRHIEMAASSWHRRYACYVGAATRAAGREPGPAHPRPGIESDREDYARSAYADLDGG